MAQPPQAPLDLACRCKACNLEFHIMNLDKLVSQGFDGFSLSSLTCPNCKAQEIDVSITARRQDSTGDEFDDLRKRLDEAFENYDTHKEDKMAKHRLSIAIVNIIQELHKTIAK